MTWMFQQLLFWEFHTQQSLEFTKNQSSEEDDQIGLSWQDINKQSSQLWWAEKDILDLDGLQQQMTTSGSSYVSQEKDHLQL